MQASTDYHGTLYDVWYPATDKVETHMLSIRPVILWEVTLDF